MYKTSYFILHLSIYLSVYLSIYLSIHGYIYIYMYIYIFILIYIYMYIYMYIYESFKIYQNILTSMFKFVHTPCAKLIEIGWTCTSSEHRLRFFLVDHNSLRWPDSILLGFWLYLCDFSISLEPPTQICYLLCCLCFGKSRIKYFDVFGLFG